MNKHADTLRAILPSLKARLVKATLELHGAFVTSFIPESASVVMTLVVDMQGFPLDGSGILQLDDFVAPLVTEESWKAVSHSTQPWRPWLMDVFQPVELLGVEVLRSALQVGGDLVQVGHAMATPPDDEGRPIGYQGPIGLSFVLAHPEEDSPNGLRMIMMLGPHPMHVLLLTPEYVEQPLSLTTRFAVRARFALKEDQRGAFQRTLLETLYRQEHMRRSLQGQATGSELWPWVEVALGLPARAPCVSPLVRLVEQGAPSEVVEFFPKQTFGFERHYAVHPEGHLVDPTEPE